MSGSSCVRRREPVVPAMVGRAARPGPADEGDRAAGGRGRRLGPVIVLGIVAWLLGAGPAAAVHRTGVFELDGNAVSAGSDDANTLFAGPGNSFDHFFAQDPLVVLGGKTYDIVYKSGARTAAP